MTASGCLGCRWVESGGLESTCSDHRTRVSQELEDGGACGACQGEQGMGRWYVERKVKGAHE